MQQRSLTRLALQDGSALLVANITTGTAVDLAPYASEGRREMRVSYATAGMTNTTSVAIVIQDNTTSTAADTGWATVTSSGGALSRTTNGHGTDVFIQTNKRYVRSVITPAASTTSYAAIVDLWVENRTS